MPASHQDDTIRELARLVRALQPGADTSGGADRAAQWERLAALASELEQSLDSPCEIGPLGVDELSALIEYTDASLAYLDCDFVFRGANRTYVMGCGYSREELIGRYHFDLFPNEENEAIFRRVRETGEPITFRAKPFVYANQPELGVTYWDWTLSPHKDANGRVRGYLFSLLDVTPQERARAATREHGHRLNRLIAASQLVLAETTREALLQRLADSAREITDSHVAVAALGYAAGRFETAATSFHPDVPDAVRDAARHLENAGAHLEALDRATTLRLSSDALRQSPFMTGLPNGHPPLRGLLGVRLGGLTGCDDGVVLVSNRAQGEFTPEDEALLVQLATIASLGLLHIAQRAEAQRHADELSAIFAAMGDAVIVVGADGAFVQTNPAVEALFGVDLTHRERHDFARRLALRRPEGTPLTDEDLPSSRVLRGESMSSERIAFTTMSGQDRIATVSAQPLQLAGAPIGGVLIWHDVTEREELLQRLSQEQTRLQAIIENAPLGIVVADDAACVSLANPAYEALWRHPTADAADAPPTVCYPDGRPWPEADRPLSRCALRGETCRAVEMLLRWPDGAERQLLVDSAPIRDAGGRLTGGVAAFQDISERKRAEAALGRYAHEQAALYAVSSATATWTDPDRLLNVVLDVVLPLMNADAGWVLLPGETPDAAPSIAASRGLPAAFLAANATAPVEGCPACTMIFQGGRAEPVPHYVANCTRFSRALLAESALHSHIVIPLCTGGRTLGVLNVGWQQPHAYSEAEYVLAVSIGQQVGLALYNARLYQEARQVNRLRVLADLDMKLASTLDPTQVRLTALRQMTSALRAPRGVYLSVARGAALPHEVTILDGHTSPWAPADDDESAVRRLIAQAAESSVPFRVSGAQAAAAAGAAVRADWGREALAIPMRTSDGSLAVLLIGSGSADRTFGDDDWALATAAAMRIAQLSENARLYEAVQRQRQQVRTLSSRLTQAQEAERQRMARELHDRIGQDLTALSFNLNIVRMLLPPNSQPQVEARIGESMALVEQTTRDVRSLMSELRPLVLDDYGLVAALQWYAGEFGRRMDLPIDVEGCEPAPRLDGSIETALFRVAQEALTNAAKHAHAERITISVATEGDVVRVIVADNGVGFEPESLTGPSESHGWGLLSMTERLEAVGGRCTIASAPGRGTRVIAEVPR